MLCKSTRWRTDGDARAVGHQAHQALGYATGKRPLGRKSMRKQSLSVALALCCALLPAAAGAQTKVKVGILNDQSGVYADTSGPGSVVSAQIAIEEFRAAHPSI